MTGKTLGRGLVAVVVGIAALLWVSDPMPAQALETRGQCLGTGVPTGWIQIDYFHNSAEEPACGAVGQPGVANWQIIARHEIEPEGTTIEYCRGSTLPFGWVIVASKWDDRRCGRPVAFVRNIASMYLPPPTKNDGQTVCVESPVPSDWTIQTFLNGQPNPCGSGVANLPQLVRHSHLPVNSEMRVCANQIPVGWNLIRFESTAAQCHSTASPPSNNVAFMRKTNAEPWNVDYVMLGDSLSSGQGSPPYDVGNAADARKCRRSHRSWTWLAYQEMAKRRTVNVSVQSCGGKWSIDVQNNQLGTLNMNTDLVTLTAGVNDIGFGSKIFQCIGPGSCANMDLTEAERNQLRTSLQELYRAIKIKIRPNAKFLVLAYPRIFQPDGIFACPYQIDADELVAIERVLGKLNLTIAEATLAEGVTFVSQTGNAFTGHRICDGPAANWWVNELLGPGQILASYHPNPAGEQRIFEMVASLGHLPLKNTSIQF